MACGPGPALWCEGRGAVARYGLSFGRTEDWAPHRAERRGVGFLVRVLRFPFRYLLFSFVAFLAALIRCAFDP